MDKSFQIFPVADEMVQRQFHGDMQYRWDLMTQKVNQISEEVKNSVTSDELPWNERLDILDRELNELRSSLNSFHGVLKTEEELELYVQRLSVLLTRCCEIQVIYS